MKISLRFEELYNVLAAGNTILSDKSVDDKMKNVIFLCHGDSVKVVAYNAFTFSRTEIDNVEVEDIPEEGWEFQVKASDLNKIMSSFSNLYKTKAERIDFIKNDVRIGVILHEEAIKEEDSKLSQISRFNLESAPILANISKEIHMEFPENIDMLISANLLIYLDSLFPLLSNDSANNTTSKLNFADDYVFVFSTHMSAFFVNRLPDSFKDLTLSYSSVSYLKKLCEQAEELGVARLDKYLCIQSGLTEAFMRYQKIKVNYKPYVENRSKDRGVVVDRLYLKDVIRRMGNIAPDGKIYIQDDGLMRVVNSSFEQVIPLNNVKEGTAGISFNVSIPVLDKSIIGKDGMFGDDLFIYFVEQSRGYKIFMSDKSAAWFSSTHVTRA